MSPAPDVVRPATVAWIESPFQLLSLVEAMHCGGLDAPAIGFLRGPWEPYAPIMALLDREPVGGLRLVAGASVRQAAEALRGARELAIGDLFSGQAGRLIVGAPHARLVVLDDGSSTLTALQRVLSRRGSLVRPRSARSRRRSAIGRVVHTAVRHRLPGGVRVVTGLPPCGALAASALTTRQHDFAWTRGAAPLRPMHEVDTVVLGSALVPDGLVGAEHYAEWIDRQFEAAGGRRGIYLPHRRDDGRSIEVVRRRGGVLASAAGLPVEMIARAFAPEVRVATLPSTTVLTLPTINPTLSIDCWDVPAHWWTDRATPEMRALMAEIAEWHRARIAGGRFAIEVIESGGEFRNRSALRAPR